ncbi:MAG TPA: long-chain fatty acid--CoA ligase [Thermoanaerobaculia bacterium]|nr:long-chain fatty acid--CoA ligase [Thermoanaerobaculia bacterium]
MIAGDLLGERARLTPGSLALVTVPAAGGDGERLSYAELDRRAEACARLLAERLGLGAGERVGLLAGNRVEFLEVFFACAKAGTVLVPIGTRLTAPEIAHLVADSGLAVLIWAGEHEATLRELASLLPLPQTVALDGPVLPTDLDYQAERRALEGGRLTRRPRLGPEDLWALLYTSGTTGKPKGVMIPHRQLLWNGYNTVISWQLTADDVTPIFTPLYHAGGLAAFLVPMVTIGGRVLLFEGFDPEVVWRVVEREGVTVMLGVPTILKRLAEVPAFETADLSRLRWAISGGAPLPRVVLDRYRERGVVLKQGYGMTEVGVNCFTMTVEEALTKAGSIGQPLPFTRARLAREDGAEAAAGEVGELWLKGPHVCRGYWRQSEATAAALDADGWFHTGDLARRDEDGFYTIAGRAKDMLISGGVNVYPAEIEGELLLHPGVADAAVVGVPHPEWGEVGVAFVVAVEGLAPSAEDLLAHLAGRLARYKHPREIVFLDALPRTPYGKVVKGELRERYLAGRGEL